MRTNPTEGKAAASRGRGVGAWLASLSIAAVILLCGKAAWATAEIPFILENQTTDKVSIICDGPWSRASSTKGSSVKAGETKTFYKAEETIFSVFGNWSCTVCAVPDCSAKKSVTNYFCLTKSASEQQPVELTLTPDFGTMTVNYPPSPPACSSSGAGATLGDNLAGGATGSSTGGAIDRDSYLLQGAAGDSLTLRVEGDGVLGHRGKRVALRLRQEDGDFSRRVQGSVPLSLKATLPADGTYRVVVLPAGKDEGNAGVAEKGPLRGGYRLSVKSTGAVSLAPSSDVEH